MGFETSYTAVLLAVTSILLVKEWVETEIVLFTTLMMLVAGEVITIEDAFAGFSNKGMLTVALLFIVAGALQNTGIVQQFNPFIFGENKGSITKKLIRI